MVVQYTSIHDLSALTRSCREFYNSWILTLYSEALKDSPVEYVYEAVTRGHLVSVQNFINAGAAVNEHYDSRKSTMLHLAVECSYPEVVKFLLSHGSDVTAVDSSGMTPLHRAAEEGHEGIVQSLLDAKANVSAVATFAGTALHRATEIGHDRIAKILLDRGADVNAVEKSGETPLHLAARNGRLNVAQLLLKFGAKISYNQLQQTPLNLALDQEMLNLLNKVVGKD
jgi:ankyrin repeat protein